MRIRYRIAVAGEMLAAGDHSAGEQTAHHGDPTLAARPQGSLLNARSPMMGLAGFESTSSTGAKLRSMPTLREFLSHGLPDAESKIGIAAAAYACDGWKLGEGSPAATRGPPRGQSPPGGPRGGHVGLRSVAQSVPGNRRSGETRRRRRCGSVRAAAACPGRVAGRECPRGRAADVGRSDPCV